MKNFDKGGRGLCLPDGNVETLHATSLNNQYRHRLSIAQVLSTLLIFVSVLFNDAFAQSPDREAVAGVGEIRPLIVGDTIPDYLWHLPLQVVNHPEGKDTITLNDYRDKKLIVLDYWSTWCGTCMISMPGTYKKLSKYGDEAVLIPISDQGDELIKPVMERNAMLQSIEDFHSVVSDTVFKEAFAIQWVPRIIILASSGMVLADTTPTILTEEMLDNLMDHQSTKKGQGERREEGANTKAGITVHNEKVDKSRRESW